MIAINKDGELEIIQNPNDMTLNLYPSNQTFHNKAMKAIKDLPDWKPAIRNGRKVKNYFTLSISMNDGVISTQLYSKNELKNQEK